MKRRIFCTFRKLIVTLSIMTALLGIALPSRASWPALTLDNMISKSDVILIGTVEGRFVTKNVNLPSGQPVTWIVKAEYYIKGGIRKSTVLVDTPPDNSDTAYNLDAWGKRVLLFLAKDEDSYFPLTPAGVAALTRTELSRSLDSITGEDLLKIIKVNDQKLTVEREAEITEFIRQSTLYPSEKSKSKLHDPRFWIINGSGAVIILAVLFILEKKGFTKKKGIPSA